MENETVSGRGVERPVVIGLLSLVGLGIVSYTVLTALGHTVDANVWLVITTIIGGVIGWLSGRTWQGGGVAQPPAQRTPHPVITPPPSSQYRAPENPEDVLA